MDIKLIAQLKAAVWALVSTVGTRETLKLLDNIRREITDSEWSGPGNR